MSLLALLVDIISSWATYMTGQAMFGPVIISGGQSLNPANFWMIVIFFLSIASWKHLRSKRNTEANGSVTPNKSMRLKAAGILLLISAFATALALVPTRTDSVDNGKRGGEIDSPPMPPLPNRGPYLLPVCSPHRVPGERLCRHSDLSDKGRQPRGGHFRKVFDRDTVEEPAKTSLLVAMRPEQIAPVKLGWIDGTEVFSILWGSMTDNMRPAKIANTPIPNVLYIQKFHPVPCSTCSGDLVTQFTTTLPTTYAVAVSGSGQPK